MKTPKLTPIQLDGSTGEGGGQILRTALALSVVTGQPFRIDRIRAGRARPGLMRQHLACVRAAAEISRARVLGDTPGSTALSFEPDSERPGEFEFAVGTAGSTMLVAQTILPPLALAAAASSVRLRGGTHNPAAPPQDFIEHSFLPLLHGCGFRPTIALRRTGFFPAGGGEVELTVPPHTGGAPLDLRERGALLSREIIVRLSGLPAHIGERECASLRGQLDLPEDAIRVETEPQPAGPGNALVALWRYERVTAVMVALGDPARSAERVAQDLIGMIRRHVEHDAPVDDHLADQLLLPCALRHGGTFRAAGWTPHAETNAGVIRLFLPDVRINATRNGRLDWTVEVSP